MVAIWFCWIGGVLFKKRGMILLPIDDKNPEELELAAIDAGAEDVKVSNDTVEVLYRSARSDWKSKRN